jgi:RND superfamily putative drug exporter
LAAELGFAVAFGILLDTTVVGSMLVTALTLDIGRHTWWPNPLSRPTSHEPARSVGAG